MATGRYIVYRDCNFRGGEVDVAATRRKDYYQDRLSDGGRHGCHGLSGQGVGDRVNIKKRDTRKRGVADGSYCSPMSSNSSGGSGCSERINHLSGSDIDRETGELSCGSGSDDAGALISRIKKNGTKNQENCVSSMATGKRKFSPIIWDKDDYEQSTVATFKNTSNKLEHVTLPSLRPLPQDFVPLHSMDVQLSDMNVLPLDVIGSVDSPQEWLENSNQEARLLDEYEEKFRPARSILLSRWADENNAVNDDENLPLNGFLVAKRRKTTSFSDSVNQKLSQKVHTPELGEVLVGENSGGDLSNISDSEGELRINNGEVEVAKVDYMDVEDESDVDAIGQLSDSEVVDNRSKALGQAQPPQRCINMLLGCRSVDEFEKLNKIDEGTYGVVFRARDKKTGDIVALKKVKMEKEREGFPLTSLREINILLSFHHPSIVDVKGVVTDSSLDKIFMVMEYMEHDLKGLMETMKQPFSQSEVKCLMLQLLSGVKYLHDNWILHRDLKTSNLLLNNHGELKICDFGMSRQYSSPLKPYTHLVVTLWYRAPELLLGAKEYSTAIDMWSVGCIMAELLVKAPLFNGNSEFDQLDKIFRTLGTPNEKIWPGFSKLPGVKVNFFKQPCNRLREKFPPASFFGCPTLSEAGFDLLNKLLAYDPEKRITAEAALNHHWFREVPLPKSKDFMPTFPAQHAQDRCLRRMMKSSDRLTVQRLKELQEGELGFSSLFG